MKYWLTKLPIGMYQFSSDKALKEIKEITNIKVRFFDETILYQLKNIPNTSYNFYLLAGLVISGRFGANKLVLLEYAPHRSLIA